MRWLLVATYAGILYGADAPRIWDEKALQDWATPIAALGVRPGHYTPAEYYAVAPDNLKTYPVYHPQKEPRGYWEWLQKQRPVRMVDVTKIRGRSDWIRAGQEAFQNLDNPPTRTNDPAVLAAVRDARSYEGIVLREDGSLLDQRWVVTESGIQLGLTVCGSCHARPMADGRILWGPPRTAEPTKYRPRNATMRVNRDSPAFLYRADSRIREVWRRFTVPWGPDDRLEKVLQSDDATAGALLRPELPGVVQRDHGSPFHMSKVPDLRTLRYSRYIDTTATHRLRGPEDVARYAAFVVGADPMEFGPHKILAAEQRRVPFRYADEVLYAIGVYLMSLEPPRNPSPGAAALVQRGQEVFTRATCVNCHAPPNYTSGKLTLAEGYTPPKDHPNKADIVNVSVGTDPGLAMKTRKGTGFYKVPSLRGLWYRPLLLHDGSVASLEEMFDPERLKPDHVPGGWKGPGVTKRAVPGHPFGLNLNVEDKAALLAFLKTL